MKCERCNTSLLKKRGRPNKYCEPCRKRVRVEDTQRWVRQREDEVLSNIDSKYLKRTIK